ncbi:hypothetical protein A6R68_02663 [Neotoma lepida]|uniref:14-3-3 domain-containing protein n=1 Tax=Neotoma lepida TaxID=56216 RepID=A0A1A6GTZ3_NEOLE|nr:hypothetical protein A6R68_02663 [Neotoma lepida]
MAICLKAVMEQGTKLSKEECSLLSVSYKNMVGGRRSTWRVISSIEQKTDTSDKKLQLIKGTSKLHQRPPPFHLREL